mmetsp:Transcript_27437/g.84212  ORF Transcript_27437/g.84212 Transcript_27437/m.84212 type:complete len:249 (+) Transcript_27437:45-791(+)
MAFHHATHQENAANAMGLGTGAHSAYALPANAIPAAEEFVWRSSATYRGLVAMPMAGAGAAAFANADHQRNLAIFGTAGGGGRFAALWEHPYTEQHQTAAYDPFNFGTPAMDPRVDGTTPGVNGPACDATISNPNLGQPHQIAGFVNLYRPYVNDRWTEDAAAAESLRGAPVEAFWGGSLFKTGQGHYHGELRPYMKQLNPLFVSALDAHLAGATAAQKLEVRYAALGYWATDGYIGRDRSHGPGKVV